MIKSIHCSKLSRPMMCAGSLFFKDLVEELPGDAAKEGTAAGEYLERILTNQPIPTHAKNGVMFNDDMKMYAEATADEIKSRSNVLLCETIIDWQTRSGIWIKGKYDVSFVQDGVLYVDDYKYGWGIIEAKDNWQLVGYAIGEVIRRAQAFSKIVLRIHQPRPHHEQGTTREWVITYDQLLALKERIEVRCDDLSKGVNDLVTGSHCRYCPAAAEACPAFNKAFYRSVEVVHDFIQDHITDDELSFQLDLLGRVSELVKMKTGSLEALAINRIRDGKLIPNYATNERLGNREWKKEISPDLIKALTGVDVTERAMLSPAKAEKIGVPKELVTAMVQRTSLGQTLKRTDGAKAGDKIFGNNKPQLKGVSNE